MALHWISTVDGTERLVDVEFDDLLTGIRQAQAVSSSTMIRFEGTMGGPPFAINATHIVAIVNADHSGPAKMMTKSDED